MFNENNQNLSDEVIGVTVADENPSVNKSVVLLDQIIYICYIVNNGNNKTGKICKKYVRECQKG